MFEKKYLEYNFFDGDLNSKEAAEEVIDNFITPSTLKSSCWWSSLASNTYGLNGLFHGVKNLQRKYFKNNENVIPQFDAGKTQTAKSCPAINNILTNSYLIKSPSDICITVTKDSKFIYNSVNNHIKVSSHPIGQFHTENDGIFNGKMNLKFELQMSIKSNNAPFILLQPMYHNNIWYDVVIGSITNKYTKGTPLNINVLVDIPKDEPITYEINAGEVLAYMWFPKKPKLKHQKNNILATRFDKKWSSKSRYD